LGDLAHADESDHLDRPVGEAELLFAPEALRFRAIDLHMGLGNGEVGLGAREVVKVDGFHAAFGRSESFLREMVAGVFPRPPMTAMTIPQVRPLFPVSDSVQNESSSKMSPSLMV
jgi:hypothetical protein